MEHFQERVRNAKPQTPYPQTLYPPYTTYPHICQTLKDMGIIHAKPWFVKYFICMNMPKTFSDFLQKDLNTFIKP